MVFEVGNESKRSSCFCFFFFFLMKVIQAWECFSGEIQGRGRGGVRWGTAVVLLLS